MTTTTHITTIDLAGALSPLAGDFGNDYDWIAITHAYADALEAACGVEGVTICNNGDVIATVETADDAREIDWREVAEDIDAFAIIRRNEITPPARRCGGPATGCQQGGEHRAVAGHMFRTALWIDHGAGCPARTGGS